MALVWRNVLILVFVHVVVSVSRGPIDTGCGKPTKYLDKELRVNYNPKVVFDHGESVGYKCALGYTPSAGSNSRSQCVQGQWTALNMKCEKKKCNALADIENGHYNQEGRLFGHKAVAVCNEGYVLRGEGVRICTEKGWNGMDPTCEVSKIICSAPAVANRQIHSGERTQYAPQDTVNIVCSEGFDLIGSPQVTCGPDSQWQGLPVCSKVITCSAPAVANGRIRPGSGDYKPRDTVDITCSEGFDLIGSAQVVCGPDGQWQALSECRPKRISVITCSAPAVANGRIRLGSGDYKPRDTVDITCSEGFDLIGSAQVVCGPDGQWQTLPECRQKRISGKCGPAPSHPHAFPRDQSFTQKEYPSGARLVYKCSVGYRRVRGSSSIRCQNGRWADLQLRCERKRCGSAGEMSYGQFEYTGVSFGDSATAVCNEGYELIGSKVRTCRDGGWDGRIPVCEPVHCPPPPKIKDAEMFDPIYDHVPFGHVLTYQCRTGALIGQREIYCTKSGTWSAPPPECKDIICPNPRVPGGSRMRGYRAVYKYGNTLTIACNPGLRLIGESFVTCGLDGEWNPKLPECRKWWNKQILN